MAANWAKSQTNMNQATLIGNQQPPNTYTIKNNVLKAASPRSFNLVQTTAVDTTPSDTSAKECRTNYQGFGGLRKLQDDQEQRTYYDPGCGWRFSMGKSTVNPSINQAALGTYKGPVRSDKDAVGGSISWNMDLQKAERAASASIATNLNNSCTNLQYLSADNQQYFGFCTSSGSIIPIQKDAAGNVTARFPNDTTLSCPPANIIPAIQSPGACQTAQGFANPKKEAFRGDQKKNSLYENFTSINDLGFCKPPLTRDCVILAARSAGCGDEGTLISALQATPKGSSYSTNLKNNPAFIAYSQSANPGITPAVLADGSASVGTALNDFGNMVNNIQSTNPRLSAASKDLCMDSGYFTETYNWCADMSPTTTITSDNIACVQNHWKNLGGTEQGSGYPLIGAWNGKSYQSYISYAQNILTTTKSTDKSTQNAALQQLYGTTSSYSSVNVDGLPMSANINGAETVWIELGNYWNDVEPPVILRCDLKMSRDGEIIPKSLNDYSDMQNKYKMPSLNGVAFINAFEYRRTTDAEVRFSVTADDGFMVGVNQNPFENTVHAKNDWGSWRYQPPTSYNSGTYRMGKDTNSTTNTVVTKFFQGQGGAYFHMIVWEDSGDFKDPSISADARKNMYLTQEPNAPWLQYEVCTRPNLKQGTKLGFFEKRWNGPVAFYQNEGINSPIPSFDTVSQSVITQTGKDTASVPGNKAYLTFTSNSWWHTKSMFAFTAFQTITLLVRPSGTWSAGAELNLLTHRSQKGGFDGINLTLHTPDGVNYVFVKQYNQHRQQIPCVPNQWNLVVFQYVGNSTGITNISMDAMDLPTLQTPNGLSTFFSRLRQNQSISGGAVMPPITTQAQRSTGAGYLILGMNPNSDTLRGQDYSDTQGTRFTQRLGFTGDVAWIHGFRSLFTSASDLQKEVSQTWASRWPRANIDRGFMGAPVAPGLAAPRPECMSNNGRGIILYQHCEEYAGWSKVLSVGEYDITKFPGSFPDDASFITVPLGFNATIFAGPIDVGRSKNLIGPTKWSFCNEGSWANDKIRAIRVTAAPGNRCYSENQGFANMDSAIVKAAPKQQEGFLGGFFDRILKW